MLDIQQIEAILPHRYPFLLVDRVEALVPGAMAQGVKLVSANEPFFQGHFPQEKVMPGVLIIEALAQLGAIALLALPEFKGKTPYFGGIQKARFRKKVVPGDKLQMKIDIATIKSGMGKGMAEAYVDGLLACKAELLFAIEMETES